MLLATSASEVARAAAAVDEGRGTALEPLARRVTLSGDSVNTGTLGALKSIEGTRIPLTKSTVPLPLLERPTLMLKPGKALKWTPSSVLVMTSQPRID